MSRRREVTLAYLGWSIRVASSGFMKLTWANAVLTALPAAFSISSRILELGDESGGCGDDGAVVAGVAVAGCRGCWAGRRAGCCVGAAAGCGVGGEAIAFRAAISRARGDDASPKRSFCPKTVMAWSICSEEAFMASGSRSGASPSWPYRDEMPCLDRSAPRRAEIVLSRRPLSSAPRDASSSMICSADLVSCLRTALARFRAEEMSPIPRSSRACSSVISPVPYETASCSRRFSASRREPHAERATSSRTEGSHSISSSSQMWMRRPMTSSGVRRRKSKRWHLEMIVAGTRWISVVARIMTT